MHEPRRSEPEAAGGRPDTTIAGRRLTLPRSRLLRLLLGVALLLGGAAGFLPVLGFWMIPLGLSVLATVSPAAERLMLRAGAGLRRLRTRRRRRARRARGAPAKATGPRRSP